MRRKRPRALWPLPLLALALALLGKGSSGPFVHSPAAASETMGCSYYASPDGSDSNAGSLTAPWRTIQHAFDSAQPGKMVCLHAGTYTPFGTFDTPSYRQTLFTNGASGTPLVFQNCPGEIAIIHAKVQVRGSYVTFKSTYSDGGMLVFEGPVGPHYNDVQVSVDKVHDILFDHVEIRQNDHHAGIYLEGVYNVQIIGAYIHDNGDFSDDYDPYSGGNTWNVDQGIYWASTTGGGNLIANCVIEHNRGMGVQLFPSPSGVVIEQNTIVDNGNNGIVVFGTQNAVVNNILSDNGDRANNRQMRIHTSGNHIIDSNLLWSPRTSLQGTVDVTGQVVTHTIIAHPLFIDPANHNYHLQVGSPATGAGNPSYQRPVDRDGVSRSVPTLGAYEFVP